MSNDNSQTRDIISIVDEFKNIDEINRSKKKGMQTVASMEMIGLLRSTITKIQNSSNLKDLIEAKLVTLITDSEEELAPAALLRFYELLLKHENDATAPILRILEAGVKTQEQAELLQIQKNNENNANNFNIHSGDDKGATSDNNLTAKDIQAVKELLPKLEKMSEIFEGVKTLEETEN